MGLSVKAKKGFKITVLVIAIFFLIVGIINMVFSILGSQKQVGTISGYEWNSEMEFRQSNIVKTMDMGDKDFKILGIADIQRKNSGTAVKFVGVNYILDWVSEPQIKKMIKETAPDLMVLMGDSVATKSVNDLEIQYIADFMDSLGIPWTVLFGNHDDEGRADKAKLAEIFVASEYCIFEYGPKDLHGVGNFVINLTRGDSIEYSLYVMDSGVRIDIDGESVYDGINANQVSWYNWASDGINAMAGKEVKNMAFFHIPIPEYLKVTKEDIILGESNDTASPAGFNAGFFDAFKANSGTHMWVGHDHTNNFVANYQDVKLGYVQKSSYNSYFDGSMVGGTVITINANNEVKCELYNF